MSAQPFDGYDASDPFADINYHEVLNSTCSTLFHPTPQAADMVVAQFVIDDAFQAPKPEQLDQDPRVVDNSIAMSDTASQGQMASRLTVEEDAGDINTPTQLALPSVNRPGRQVESFNDQRPSATHFGNSTITDGIPQENFNPLRRSAIPTSYTSSFGNHPVSGSSAYQGISAYGYPQVIGYGLRNPSLVAPSEYQPLTRAVHYGVNSTSGNPNSTPSFGQEAQPMPQSRQLFDNVRSHTASVSPQSGRNSNSTS